MVPETGAMAERHVSSKQRFLITFTASTYLGLLTVFQTRKPGYGLWQDGQGCRTLNATLLNVLLSHFY